MITVADAVLPMPSQGVTFFVFTREISAGQYLQLHQWFALGLQEFPLLKFISGQSAWKLTPTGQHRVDKYIISLTLG